MADETSKVNFIFTSTDKTKNILGGITKSFVAVGTAAVAAGAAGVAALVAVGVSSVKVASSMESAMSGIAAVMGKTVDEIAPLSDLIEDLGLDPNLKVDALEAAAVVDMLARNGLNMSEIINGAAKSTVLLANATGGDFAAAADIGTDAMSIFGIAVGDMGEAVDGIVSVTTKSKLGINDYALAMANGASRFKAAGGTFSDFNTTIALIADEAGNGQKAGTALGAMMQRLSPQTEKAKDAMAELGIITAAGNNRFFDATGAFLGMGNAADVLNDSMGGLSDIGKIDAISDIFSIDASAAVLGLMKETGASFSNMQEEMGQSSAVDSAAVRMDNLAGQWEILGGIVETVQLQIGEKFLPVLKDLVKRFASLAEEHSPAIVAAFAKFSDWFTINAPIILEFVVEKLGAFKNWIVETAPKIREFVSNVFGKFSDWIETYAPIITRFVSNAFGKFSDWIETYAPIITRFVSNVFGKISEWVIETAPLVQEFVANALGNVQQWFADNEGNINNFIENALKPFIALVLETADNIKEFLLAQFEKISAWYVENEELIKNFAVVMATVWAAAWVALVTFWDVVEPILGALIDLVLEIATVVMAVATGDWATAWEAMSNLASLQLDVIKAAFTGLANWVTGWFGTSWEEVMDSWRGVGDNMKLAGRQIMMMFILGIGEKANDVKESITSPIKGAFRWLEILGDQIKGIGGNIMLHFRIGVISRRNEVIDAIKKPINDALDWFDGLYGRFKTYGKDTLKGFIQGVNDMRADIITAVLRPFTGAIDAVMTLLDLHSPSKLFEEMGMNTGKGFEIGIMGQTADVARAGTAMAGAAVQGAQSSTKSFTLQINNPQSQDDVIRDFGMLQAWA